ncbi:phosphotransferase enzyme family protein [Paenibacillus methanolicus]|uniref:Ser/Thr protein kinase RdoA (MazF antagonist) n=1 Tax=Paenibacillus methanolicus TaxID=582686 RepID=A0A5S5C7V9_9BACL|nr:phosphotransferase [Paenibacillus methanolicus]TYP74572.1 Ser/Thr protein kinase RdoA (MazF antagonist) [Paenibacillus methanolicus]
MDPRTKSSFRDEHAAEGARRYGVRPEELTFIGGFQNFIYAYHRDDAKYILRFTPGALRTEEGLEAELEWIRFLSRNGVSVSESVVSVAGLAFELILGDEMDFYATSFMHAPGRRIGYPECLNNAELVEGCGRVTGRLHELSRRYAPLARRHAWDRNEYLLKADQYIPSEHHSVLHALEELKAELARLPVTPDNFGLIHGDINAGNFTVDSSGELTLFDFDECQYSWYVEDIAVQLYYLLYVFGEDSKPLRKAQYELFLAHFENGYADEGRRMPKEWRDQLPLFLRLREIIVFIGMHRSWDLREPDQWTRDFIRDSRMRITNGLSLIDGL